MQAKVMSGYEGAIAMGQKRMVVFIGTGPGLPGGYLANGDPLRVGVFPHLDLPIGGLSISGNYRVEFKADHAGPRANWVAMWTTAPTTTVPEEPVAPGVDLSAESVICLAFGGDF